MRHPVFGPLCSAFPASVLLCLGLLAGCAAQPAPGAAPQVAGVARITVPASPRPVPEGAASPTPREPRLPPAPTLPPGPSWIIRPPAPAPLARGAPESPPPSREAGIATPPPAAAPAAPAQPAAAAPRPGVGPQERRQFVDSATAPWRSIGMVAAEGGGRCTGAVIGPRTVLTAAHCLFQPQTGQPFAAQSLSYVIGPTGQGPGRRVAVAAYRIAPGFTVRPGLRPAPDTVLDADWAVLQLDPNVPPAPDDFILPLVAGLMPQWTVLALGGYQPDRGPGLVADLECWVVGYSRFGAARLMLRHSCAATVGSSGGPLLVRTTEGAWMVAGVGSLAIRDSVGGWAVPSLTITRGLEAMAAEAAAARTGL